MNKELNQYQDTIAAIVSGILKQERAIANAAKVMAESISKGNVVHVIGPGGHSNMAAEEVLWRAGGLVCLNSILDSGTNLIHGAKRSNYIERLHGYAAAVLDSYRVGRKPGEVIIIVNAYGINPMCVDTALEAKKRGMISIGITSKSFADSLPKDHPSRHSSGDNLYQLVDHFIDCGIPYGDAVVEVAGCKQKVGPTATICNIIAINCLIVETVKALVALGIDPPVWMSANLPGGDMMNKANEEKYSSLIRHL